MDDARRGHAREDVRGVDVESKVSQAVRKQAAKFIEWLDESDDEDSD